MNRMDTGEHMGLRGLSVIEVGRLKAHIAGGCSRMLVPMSSRSKAPKGTLVDGSDPFPTIFPTRIAADFSIISTPTNAAFHSIWRRIRQELFQRLFKTADVLVSDHAPPSSKVRSAVRACEVPQSTVIACSVTPFGLTGPYRDYNADDIVMLSLGGMTAATPGFPDYVVSREKSDRCVLRHTQQVSFRVRCRRGCFRCDFRAHARWRGATG